MFGFYFSLIMVIIICFGSGIEFARFIFLRNKRNIYENLKIYFEEKGEA